MKTSSLFCVVTLIIIGGGLTRSVRGAAFNEVNLALAGTATQSSDIDDVHTAALAIDGNTNGAWAGNSVTHTLNTDDLPWWEVDLGGAKTIGRVHVWFRTDCCQNRNDDFTVFVLDASRNEVWQYQYVGRPPTNLPFDFAPAIQGQYVRIEGQTPRTTSDGYLSLAEVQVIAPYENVSITVTKQPQDSSIFENQSATFGPVEAQAADVPADKFRIQWQKNGADIPGATKPTYSTPPQKAGDSGTEYAVQISLPGLAILSSKAKLTVNTDPVAPTVQTVNFTGGATLHALLRFSELMDPSSTTDKSNYAFTGGPTVTDVTLIGSTLDPESNVFFSTADLTVVGLAPNVDYSLDIKGAKDLAGNTIAPVTLKGNVGFYEINHARGGAATQSSDIDAVHTAQLAIDGNTDGRWASNSVTHTLNSDDPAWWEVDLGSVKTIGRVTVWFRTDCCLNRNDDFVLAVLDGNRGEVFKQTYAGRPGSKVSYDFPSPIQARYLRIEGQAPRTTSDGYLSLTEVEAIAAYENVSFDISQPPADTTGLEARGVTFGPVTVSVVGAPQEKLAFQWQKNGADIPGATALSYTTPPLLLADNGAEYSVRVLLPGLSKVSAKAKLTVTKDTEPPKVNVVDSVASADKATFFIRFDELMDAASAATPANYVVAGGSTTEAALASDNQTAVVTVTGLGTATRYSLAVKGVKDLGGNPVADTTLIGTLQIDSALAGTASQSSELSGGAELAIDGNTDGRFSSNSVTHTGNADNPPVWEVDLGSVKQIGAVRVWFRTDCCQNRNDDFTVYVLDASRTEVQRRKHPGRPPAAVIYNFAPAVQGQYIRIEGQSPRTTSDGYLSLAEVQVFNAYETETITIAQGLADVTAFESTSATFGPIKAESVGVPADKISHQWQKNGIDIPGAYGASYTTPALVLADDGAEYTVKALIAGISTTSKAKLTVKAGPAPTDVVLRIQRNAGSVLLSWPSSAAGYALEFSDALGSAAWQAAAEQVSTQGDESSVTIAVQSSTRFYRLVKR